MLLSHYNPVIYQNVLLCSYTVLLNKQKHQQCAVFYNSTLSTRIIESIDSRLLLNSATLCRLISKRLCGDI